MTKYSRASGSMILRQGTGLPRRSRRSAEKLLVTGGNVTYVMDRLEAQGLVARERSGDDRRVVRAHLTTKGRATIEGVFPSHVGFVRGLVQGLGAEERDDLRALLKKLGKGIADGGGDGSAC